uniref:Uncharacterized protein n=1 Tax=Tanacetum cinerariifolium TaxID=118510 RepID=A0A699HNI4_TANCI|nr:hypothetical protein [Tanacetum cinerariifolium]
MEYVFKEADLPSLHLNDIEDIFPPYYQNKLHHLDGKIQTDLVVALWFFIRRTVIKHRVKDVQLGMESYQTKHNLTKPQVLAVNVDRTKPYTIFYKPRDKDKKRAMSMVKVIEKTLHRKRIIKSLECYVGGRNHEYNAKAFKNSKVRFSTPTGGILGEVGVTTFRNAIGVNYLSHSSEYDGLPSFETIREWFLTIRYSEEIKATGTLIKYLLPPRWRFLMGQIKQCIGGKTGGFDQISNKDAIIMYGLANRVEIDYASLSLHHASTTSTTEADLGIFAPNDSISKQQGSSFSFPFLVMSKRNLSIVTCSLSQSDLVDFVEEHRNSLCYDPKLPFSNQTSLDAPKGYIPLYLSLFSIGNLCFHLNDFYLDVFEFFWCHFPLLNLFGVVRITSFAVACKAYGEEATVPLFKSLLTLGPTGDWVTFQKMPGLDIPAIFGVSMFNIPNWKLEFIFVKQTLIFNICPDLITDFRHGQGTFAYPYPMKPFDKTLRDRLCRLIFKAQSFLEPILYLVEMAFQNFMKKPGQSPSFFVRPMSQSVDVVSPLVDRLTVTVDDDQLRSVIIVEGSKKGRSITEALKEESTIMRPMSKKKKNEGPWRMSERGSILPHSTTIPKDVEEAHATHNMLSGLHYPLFRDKLGCWLVAGTVAFKKVFEIKVEPRGRRLQYRRLLILCKGLPRLVPFSPCIPPFYAVESEYVIFRLHSLRCVGDVEQRLSAASFWANSVGP